MNGFTLEEMMELENAFSGIEIERFKNPFKRIWNYVLDKVNSFKIRKILGDF